MFAYHNYQIIVGLRRMIDQWDFNYFVLNKNFRKWNYRILHKSIKVKLLSWWASPGFPKRGRIQLHRAPSRGGSRKSRGREAKVVCAQSEQRFLLIIHNFPTYKRFDAWIFLGCNCRNFVAASPFLYWIHNECSSGRGPIDALSPSSCEGSQTAQSRKWPLTFAKMMILQNCKPPS